MIDVQTVLAGASAFVGALAGVAGVSWWLRAQFGHVHDRISGVKEVLLIKINEHEKLDAERFAKQDLALMRIELRQGDATGKTVFET